MTAAQWIARSMVADEVHGWDPLPLCERDAIAREMVDNDALGWPSLESAQAYLNEWTWV